MEDIAEDKVDPNEGKDAPQEDAAEAGRGGDTVLAHLSLGELVIPRAFLDDQQVMEQMKALFDQAGANINQYIVGDEANSKNPETGYPEFGFFKSLFKGLGSVAKIAAPIALSYFGTPALGAALGGGLGGSLGAGALIGGASGALTGGNILKGAALGGLGGALNSAVSGGFDNTALGRGVSDAYNGSTLQDLYTGASGALNSAGSGISDLYNGSLLESAFKSGGDALKSVGIDTSSLASTPAPAVGGGTSSYSGGSDSILGKDFSLGKADFGNAALDSTTPFTSTALSSATQGAPQVAGSTNYLTPALSALLGSNANSNAEKAALDAQRQNKALLAPYANGFSFTPGDLTQDPGYQFNLQQGTQATDRAQLARGGYFSGNALKEAQTFGQGLADNTYNSAFNRALQGNKAGLTGALANAGVNDTIGGAKAKTAINQGNLYSGALGSLLGGNSFTNTGELTGVNDIQALLRKLGIGNSAYAGSVA